VGPPFGRHDAIDVIAGEISVRVDLRCAEIDVIQTFEKAVGPIFDSSIFEIAEIVYQGNFHILLAPQSEAAKYEIEHAFKATPFGVFSMMSMHNLLWLISCNLHA
jgi:hypothetical protein